MKRCSIAEGQLTGFLMAVVVAATLVSAGSAQADFVTGSIAFDGSFAPNNPLLSAATQISFPAGGQEVTFNQEFGSYASVPNQTLVTFSVMTLSPASPPTDLLWTFTTSGRTYSFEATSMTASFNPTFNIWNVGGSGVATITGFQDTPGLWNLSLAQTGYSCSFASTAGVIPEPGTLILVSLGFAALCMTHRQMTR